MMEKYQNQQTNLLYNKHLRLRANSLRKDMTKAEACLWKYVLRAGLMKGYSFNRQRPVLHYIADFMCKKLRLIIEVDGLSHHDYDVQNQDNRRQKDLELCGFTVIRFNDEEVLNNLPCVIRCVETCIEQLESNFSSP